MSHHLRADPPCRVYVCRVHHEGGKKNSPPAAVDTIILHTPPDYARFRDAYRPSSVQSIHNHHRHPLAACIYAEGIEEEGGKTYLAVGNIKREARLVRILLLICCCEEEKKKEPLRCILSDTNNATN